MRLFIGVWLSPEQREEVAVFIRRLSPESPDWKWTSPANLHFTLRFLGEVDRAAVGPLRLRLQEEARRMRHFTMRLGTAGFFPPAGPPRVFWFGLAEGAAELTGLAARVENACRERSFGPADKPFKPHLTVARAKTHSPGTISFANPLWRAGTLVTGFSLIESQLRPAGPAYRSIADLTFGAKGNHS